MKKVLIIAACALLLLGIIAVAAVSQNDLQIDVTPDKTVVCRGDTVIFTVRVSGDQAFTSLGYVPNYQSNVFEVIRTAILTEGHVLADFPVKADGGVVAFDNAAVHSGDVFRFTVRIRDDAPLGTFSVTDITSIMNDRNKVDHAVNETTVTVADHKWQDATCTAPKTCSVCKTTEGEPLGHKWTDANCTTPKTCSVCKTAEGAALGHSYSGWAKLDEAQHGKTCSGCGDVQADPHTYENNLCTVCGDHELWSYTISNGAVTITGYTGPDGEIQFPDKIDGITVTTVAANAFKNANITKVIYSGRTKAWDAMTIGSGNDALKNAPRICTGDVRFASATLTLENNLSVDFKIDEAMCTQQGFENPYIVFAFNGKETIVREYDYDKTQKRYIFHFRNVAASQCNDTIYAVVHATADGIEYTSKVLEYSVATYCYAQLAQPAVIANTELRTLLVDLLNYGAVSQQYMNYNTDALVNAGLTAEQKSWASDPEPKLTTVLNTKYQTVENPTAKWKSAGLVLESAIDMRLQLETTNIDGLSVKISTDKQSWTIDSSAFETAPGTNRYYVHFNALHAAQMSEPVYLTVYRNGVAVSNTLRYSIESYAQDKQNSTEKPYLADLVKAMMNYGNSAYAYTN